MASYPPAPTDPFIPTGAATQVAEILDKSWNRANGFIDNLNANLADQDAVLTNLETTALGYITYTPPTTTPTDPVAPSGTFDIAAPTIPNATFNPGTTTVTGTTVSVGDVALLNTVTATEITAGTVSSSAVAASDASATAIVEPVIDIPLSQSAADMLDTFDVKYGELIDVLASKFVAFRAAYFPDEQNAYLAAEDWLQAAVANPNAGLPPAVVSQIWGDDHARITADKQRAQASLEATFASRRFPLPPGVLASASIQLEQKAQDEMAESSRKVAILSAELQKFNIEKLLGLRQSAMGSTIEYVKALASGPDIASRVIGIGYDAESKFISSVSQFYGARIQAAESYNKIALANKANALEASKASAGFSLDAAKSSAGFALDAAKTTAQLDFEADKTILQTELDYKKTNKQMSLEAGKATAQIALEASKATSQNTIEVDKTVAMLESEHYKAQYSANVEASKHNAAMGMQAAVHNAKAALDSNIANNRQTFDVNMKAKDMAFQVAAKKAEISMDVPKMRLENMKGELQAIAAMATALYNNLHAQASIGSDAKTGVSYSYSNDTLTAPSSVTWAG
jgi:hypothetical protein